MTVNRDKRTSVKSSDIYGCQSAPNSPILPRAHPGIRPDLNSMSHVHKDILMYCFDSLGFCSSGFSLSTKEEATNDNIIVARGDASPK